MFRSLYSSLLICTGCLLLLLGACSTQSEAEWTILIYMAADNGLNNAALADINEMEAAVFSDRIRVIVQIDNNADNPEPGAFRYHIRPDDSPAITSPVITALGEIDSGDYLTLRNFVQWGYSRYPARRQALVIWSHGNGWYNYFNKFCPDHESGSSISLPDGDLFNALYNTGFWPDLIILDACHMQTMEVLAELNGIASYVIGSEAAICSDGFPYNDILSAWESVSSPASLAVQIVQQFYESYLPGGSQNPTDYYVPVSCSAAEMNKFPELYEQLDELAEGWLTEAGAEYFSAARNGCLEFNDLEADVDIKQFFTLLLNEEIPLDLELQVTGLLEQLELCFIAQEYIDLPADDIATACLWFPDAAFDFNNLLPEYRRLRFAQSRWDEFLVEFLR